MVLFGIIRIDRKVFRVLASSSYALVSYQRILI